MGLEDFISDNSAGPSIFIANISQDHWQSCASGPNTPESHDGHSGPWTAISKSGPDPSFVFNEDDIILARRTNRTSEGSIGDQDSGVYGIWEYNYSQAIETQSSHPWNQDYHWCVYCNDIETHYTPLYAENWDSLNFTPQILTGEDVYKLSSEHEKRYLEEILTMSDISKPTKKRLEQVLEQKS